MLASMKSRWSTPGAPTALFVGLAGGFTFLIGLALGAGALQSDEAIGVALAAIALCAALFTALRAPARGRRC